MVDTGHDKNIVLAHYFFTLYFPLLTFQHTLVIKLNFTTGGSGSPQHLIVVPGVAIDRAWSNETGRVHRSLRESRWE